MLGNLGTFDPAQDALAPEHLTGIDSWILVRAEALVARCLEWYGQYAFHKVYRALYDFATVDLSAIYFDVVKDRLYTAAPTSALRRSAQTALHRLNLALVRLLAPILSFTCEEVWKHTKSGMAIDSVHLAYFPEAHEPSLGLSPRQRQEAADWESLRSVRDDVLKALDTAREEKVIGSGLEAAVLIQAAPDMEPLLRKYLNDLPAWFIVSQVELKAASGEGMQVQVQRARGDKCERCWKYTTDVGSDENFPTVCASCAAVLQELLG
jgi:isoleucyl-tRNA synthetase